MKEMVARAHPQVPLDRQFRQWIDDGQNDAHPEVLRELRHLLALQDESTRRDWEQMVAEHVSTDYYKHHHRFGGPEVLAPMSR